MNPLLIRRRGMMQAVEVVDTYLTFTALADNSSVQLTAVGSAPAVSLEYNTGGGWLPYTVGDTISLNDGDSVKMRGVNTTFGTLTTNYHKFVMTGSIDASGDITSLINGFGGDVALRSFCFISMFQGCTSLVSAPNLPATTLASSCYESMFQGCTSLVSAPNLPVTTLATKCCRSMFQGCTGLTQAPALPATTLASSCYQSMFQGCTGLTQAPALPATTLASSCYEAMFQGCTSLVSAPSLTATMMASSCYRSMFIGCTSLVSAPNLPATTLATNCYQAMFNGCTSLVSAPNLPATTLATNCYQSMFQGCTHITSHQVATLNNSANVFYNNASCTSFTIDADTPPTIGSNTIAGLKSDCIIYVPAVSVAAYQAAQYWSARASYIQAQP